MNVEISLTSARAKTRAIAALREAGRLAGPGPIRLAYPFSILVEGETESAVAEAVRLVGMIDPGAGTIMSPLAAPA